LHERVKQLQGQDAHLQRLTNNKAQLHMENKALTADAAELNRKVEDLESQLNAADQKYKAKKTE